jgi:uncharacterized membrane protein YhaH (DUF805 family)
MFVVLFGDIKNGRLQRLPFLGYSLLIFVLLMLVMMGIVLAIVGAEKFVGGDLQQAQAAIAQSLGIPFVVLFAIFMVVMFFIEANVMAKRIRDIGLPGWWVVLALAVIGSVVGRMVSEQAGGSFQMLVFVLLLLVPSNSFGKS